MYQRGGGGFMLNGGMLLEHERWFIERDLVPGVG